MTPRRCATNGRASRLNGRASRLNGRSAMREPPLSNCERRFLLRAVREGKVRGRLPSPPLPLPLHTAPGPAAAAVTGPPMSVCPCV